MSVLTNLDRLILAQAVYELGSNSWPAVAKLLSKHPLLSRPKSFFTSQVSPTITYVVAEILNKVSCILVMSCNL